MHNKSIILVVVLVLALFGCAVMDERQQNTAKGTTVGTGLGAAVAGYVWSSRMEEKKDKWRRQQPVQIFR